MSKTIQAIRGMNDILPAEIGTWQFVEAILRRLTAQYGYQEIRLPVVEVTPLFKRTIGEVTDIVEKEMYEFEDRNGDSICMRPEGTAGCVRAGIQHGLLYNKTPKLWYSGPMYRYERPQKGRYRQFYQFGLEAFGIATPDIDAELIAFTAALWRELGLTEHLSLQINSLGTREVRAKHREALVAYYSDRQDQLDEDSQRRLTTNPLRILDSKNPDMIALNDEAPKLLDYLDEASKAHFERLCELLTAMGIQYQVNPCLVRGLDYYTKTVFEWVTTELGAQGTVCAGGRYDGLVEQLGGPKDTPAIGLSMGLERLILLLQEQARITETAVVGVYLILAGAEAESRGMKIAEDLRQEFDRHCILTNLGGGSIKKQFKRADKSGAMFALVLGEDELAKKEIKVKRLRKISALNDSDIESFELNNISQLVEYLGEQLGYRQRGRVKRN